MDLQVQTPEAVQSTNQTATLTVWTKERLDLLKSTVAAGLTDNEFRLFVEICKMRDLNPFARQIYAIKRDGRMVIQTSIDGYRLIAERTGKYLGQTPPEWCGLDGTWTDIWTKPENPFACRLGVFKAGHSVPTVGVAYWNTYVAPGPFWKKGGASQLAKCSEALALRKAFPEELSGIYTQDEMDNNLVEATIVTDMNVPTDAEKVQPVMMFPKEVIATNAAGVLLKDTSGLEWVFPAAYSADVSTALDTSGFLLVYYVVESGRRVVTKLGAA